MKGRYNEACVWLSVCEHRRSVERKEGASINGFLPPSSFFQLSEMSLKQHSGCRDRLRGERKREPRTSETWKRKEVTLEIPSELNLWNMNVWEAFLDLEAMLALGPYVGKWMMYRIVGALSCFLSVVLTSRGKKRRQLKCLWDGDD